MILSSAQRFCAMAVVLGAILLAPALVRAETLTVFAAASLKTALDRVAADYQAETGQSVTLSYAGSPILSRQIQLGAPADVFVSANSKWMDVLETGGQIDATTRVDLLGNSLVLVGSEDAGQMAEIGSEFNLIGRLKGGYLAMAMVDAVPAGLYGKAALQHLGLWECVSDKVAQADNVRAALALVATGAAPLGIVYATDALAEERVQIVAHIPETAHPPIVYPAAVTQRGGTEAREFLTYLQGDTVQRIFAEQGFTLPGE
ncbi:molybdate ABC transporter substrate-binding protein [Ruegeria sp. HKCCD8929]|uniref:molybdate ABC transporter substrate-binding protein n=1 Tax=Ruegeria sp. HKCCD8929 TaxID=2683006 RepID=UPI0020C2071B|nr:molybdate ABC transporter substrate-binding protein [Ruegeria sp. HKCCD8929]